MLKKKLHLKLSLSLFFKLLCSIILIIMTSAGVVYSQEEVLIDKNSEENPSEHKNVIEVKRSASGNIYPTIETKHHDTEAPAKAFENPTINSENPNLTPEEKDVEEIYRKQKALEEKLQQTSNKLNGNLDIEAKKIEEKRIKDLALKLNPNKNQEEIKKMKIHEAVQLALAPIQLLSEKEILRQLLENTKGTKTYDVLIQFPKLTSFSIQLIKDKKAIVDASKVLEDREKLVLFSGIMFTTILIGLFLKKIISTATDSLFRIIFFFLLRVLIMLCLRIGIIIHFFGDELSGVYRIFLHSFFN